MMAPSPPASEAVGDGGSSVVVVGRSLAGGLVVAADGGLVDFGNKDEGTVARYSLKTHKASEQVAAGS